MVTGVDPVRVASTLFDQDRPMPEPSGLSALFVSWGQFVDHDLSLTPDASGEEVTVPGLVAPLVRSSYDPATGIDGPREQVNEVTAALDGSMIYGSDPNREALLRSFEGGRLRTSSEPGMADGLMPLTTGGDEMAGDDDPSNPLFLAGDVRANENTGLTVLQTLFVREHNRWADRLADEHPGWTDDQLFRAARSVVETEIQQITYRDWLPRMIGDALDTTAPSSDSGQVATEFSTAAFRFGHTMVSARMPLLSETGDELGALMVADQFFNVDWIKSDGIDPILRGQAASSAQAFDTKVIDDLNLFLTLATGVTGFSLPALNLLRGRDHGLPGYLDARAQIVGDIAPVTMDLADFSAITDDRDLQFELAAVYGTLDRVDLWVGGLAEDAVGDGLMGPTFTAILADQFARTRAADDGFGTLVPQLSADMAEEIAGTTLADIIRSNTDIHHLQDDVFASMNRMGGAGGPDRMKGTSAGEMMVGKGAHDHMAGRGGSDLMYGDTGHDRLHGGRGDDTLDGGAGSDRQWGGHGNDLLVGGRGNDHLHGGEGEDTLDGGAGDDVLKGGAHADLFVFAAGNRRDTVKQFVAGEDQVHFVDTDLTRFADLLDVAVQRGGNVEIGLGPDLLVLQGVDLEDLSPGDFLFS